MYVSVPTVWIRNLKPKETRLRDWNRKSVSVAYSRISLETKRNSITRLKHYILNPFSGGFTQFLKPKETRLRDWNPLVENPLKRLLRSWNQKKLDYEIETVNLFSRRIDLSSLKPKETRLRDWNMQILMISGKPLPLLKPKETRLRDWNWTICERKWRRCNLETKRNSITRLKPLILLRCVRNRLRLKPKETRLRDWNRQIEPLIAVNTEPTWNQKKLDYEIETRKSQTETTA